MGALDPIDWQLLSLMADAVAPAVAPLATAAGISEADAAKRIERMRESGVIAGIQARIAPERVVLESKSRTTEENAVFTRRTREFARRWNGSGVDTDLVDPEALRDTWLSVDPHAPSMSLLQQAWLAQRR